jgi:hypothetical protein
MWQATSNTNPKATVASETACVAAYLIYQNYGDSSYLTKAQGLYNYMLAHAFIASTGEVEGAKDTPDTVWGLSTADNGMFAIASLDLGYTANANLTCDFVTNYWSSISMARFTDQNTAGGPQDGIALRGMARAHRDPIYQQAACDNAWSKRNMYGLVFCNWAATTSDTYNQYCSDDMSLPAGMACVPVISVTWANYQPVDQSNGGWDEVANTSSHVNNTSGSLSMVVNNSNMGGDPAPGHVKQLIAKFTIGGNLETLTVQENATMNVMAASGTVVSAVYRPLDGFNNGANVINRITSVRGLPINATTMGGDPAPGRLKELKMIYNVGGSLETVEVIDNSVLNL